MKRETTIITVDHSPSRTKRAKSILPTPFLENIHLEQKNTLLGSGESAQCAVAAKGRGKGFSGTLSHSVSFQDGTYDIPVCSPSLTLIHTQSPSKALPLRWKILLLWQTFRRGEGSIQQSKAAEEGKQTVLAECGVHVAAETFQEVGQRRECMLKRTRFENSLG